MSLIHLVVINHFDTTIKLAVNIMFFVTQSITYCCFFHHEQEI
jgi:hypothetical protein